MRDAVLHIDGDSFFASCETSLNPRLLGKPVVTGKERGIASSMSKEAKALGVTRGMPVFKIKEHFPQVVILSSDYSVYETFAQRMFAIVRRYTDHVEEYSIDECFALLRGSEEEMSRTVREIKSSLQSELGMTFSLGLAHTKVLAKLASSKNKPDGLTILNSSTSQVDTFLEDVDVGKVWGIGPATAGELRGYGIRTALDLKSREERWVRESLGKHTREIWYELNSERVFPIESGEGDSPKSIQATRTFTPPTSSANALLSELSKNTENASVKMRRENLFAKKIYFFLKTQDFRYKRYEVVLDKPLYAPSELFSHIERAFSHVYDPRLLYRATGVTLAGLTPSDQVQEDLFGDSTRSKVWLDILKTVDSIDRRYGSHTLTLASSMEAYKRRGGAVHKRLCIPYMGEIS